jgi:hypothetical protein
MRTISRPLTGLAVTVLLVMPALAAPGTAAPSANPAVRPGAPAPLPTPAPVRRLTPGGLRQVMDQVAIKAQSIPSPPSGTWGIVAYGSGGGGIFRDSDGGAESWLGTQGYGIEGFGNAAGGFFQDADSSGYAYVGYGNYGIWALGSLSGGYFADSDSSGYAYVGDGDYGIAAWGNSAGGTFKAANGSGNSYVGKGDVGIEAHGDAYGVEAHGKTAGGYFLDSDSSGYAYVAYGPEGIQAYGDSDGGYFDDLDNGTSVEVAANTYKIIGTGTVAFVQNHPTDPFSVIVYAAPEGDEVATYTRGTAKLINGEAHVALGDTFKWVTNPDLGLTAYVTPRGECKGVYVASVSPTELVVKELDGGTSDATFDYIVYGLRIGFEQSTVVQEKKREAYIPSFKSHRDLLARRPDLAKYTALARFTAQRKALGIEQPVSFARADALEAAIHEFDPKVDKIPQPEPPQQLSSPNPSGGASAATTAPPRLAQRGPQPVTSTPQPAVPLPAATRNEDVYARSFRPAAGDLASLVEVGETVETGDVLVIDREHAGAFVRSHKAEDRAVGGVVADDPGLLLGAKTDGTASPHRVAVVFSGPAECKVDASFGPIEPGDLLVSSPEPGVAMREDSPLPGTVVGKALEPLAEGQGTIKILVTLR